MVTSWQMCVFLIALLLGTLSSPLVAFGGFDPAKWNDSGVMRVFEENGGKYLSGVSRTGGFNNGASTFTHSNDMRFLNPNSVNTIEATVTLLEATAVGSGFTSFPRAALEGHFYWDGTGTGSSSDQTGHVFASVYLALNTDTGLPEARYFVIKCTSSDCSTITTLVFTSLGSVTFFEPHTLKVDYDGTRFSFSLDTNTPVTFTPTDTTRNAPTVQFKTLRTRILIPASASASASVLALFEDVKVNGLLYDDFDTKTLPRAKFLPGSGTYASTQSVDAVIMVETNGEAVSDVRLTATVGSTVYDLTGVLTSMTQGTLASGGKTYRYADLPLGWFLGITPILWGVEATTASGAKARGFALWNVLNTTE